MAYNKARAERKWKCWKKKEERLLRILGMEEKSIQRLRLEDWEEFNSDRRFQERWATITDYLDWEDPNPYHLEVTRVPELLDCISDERLFNVLMNTDKRTLQILLLKIMGFSGQEISKKIGISENSINTKIKILRKKI